MKNRTIKYNLEKREHRVTFCYDTEAPDISNDMARLFSDKKMLLVIDKSINKKVIKNIFKDLEHSDFDVKFLMVDGHKSNKTEKLLFKIIDKCIENKFTKKSLILSCSGGVVGDVCALASSLYLRGLIYFHIPTTMTAIVDSCIGGKTGINNNFGKNLVGSFYQPDLVISDIKLLNSLPYREIICGYAEILKSSLIDSYKNFKFLNKNLNKILKLKSPFIEKAIIDSCKLKKKIVEKDEKEKNLRKVLNLGHTFAHAYESTLKFTKKLNHGEAVIIGIKNAIKFSNKNKVLSNQKFQLINEHINKIGLTHEFSKLFKKKDLNKILNFIKSNKKNNSSKINLILIKDFGKIKTNFQINSLKLKPFLLKELNK